MRIMEVVQSLEKGGRTVRFSDTVSGLRNQGHIVFPICFSTPAEWVSITDLEILPRKGGINWKLVYELRELIKRHKIDVVHAHCEFSQLYAGLAGKLVGVPTVGTFHRSDLKRYQPSLVNSLIKLCLSHFVSVSSDRMGVLREQLKIPPVRSSVVHGGTEVNEIPTSESIADVRKSLSIPTEQLVLLSLGHLGEIKGHQDTLDSISVLSEQYPDLHLYIAGDGSPAEKQRLLDQIDRLQLQEKVTLLGQILNAPLWIEACDVFVQPSLEEAFGLVFIEAGAKAKPVVATRVGGIVDIVEQDKTGFLVPPADPESLAEALKVLLDKQELRKQMGNAAYQRVAKLFSISSMVKSYEEIFSDCLN